MIKSTNGTNLEVGNISIEDNTITTTSGDLNLTAAGDVVIDNLEITGTVGDLVIDGTLTVNGTTTTINTTTITVDDKNIELGSVSVPTDITADGGGITLKGTTDKTLNWVDATDAWTSSEHIDVASGKEYRINNISVLSSTTLGTSVVNSSLTSVGTLSSLQVDNINIDGNTIASTNANGSLILDQNGTGALQRDSGGNARGQYAVDLQKFRTAASQVASGNYSVIGGGVGNIASGSRAFVGGGQSNTSSAYRTVVAGGRLNTASGNYSSVLGGRANNASAESAVIGGGWYNAASGVRSCVSGGRNNTASGQYSSVNGGFYNTASGLASICNGLRNTAAGNGSAVLSGSTAMIITVTIASPAVFNTVSSVAHGLAVNNIVRFITTGALPTGLSVGVNYYIISAGFSATSFQVSTSLGGSAVNTSGSQSGTHRLFCTSGQENSTTGTGDVVCGGTRNVISSIYGRNIIAGGRNNTISGLGQYAFIGGGLNNRATFPNATIGGGSSHTASNNYATISGGLNNVASGNTSTICGGRLNVSSNIRTFVGGGYNNNASGACCAIGGGNTNAASASYNTIAGGRNNTTSSTYAFIGGGYANNITGSGNSTYSTIAGGRNNDISASNTHYGTIGGGFDNNISGASSQYCTIGGGRSNNVASNVSHSTIPGGYAAKTGHYGALCHAAGSFASAGDAQHMVLIARRNTTDDTANQVLFLDGSTLRLTIPAQTVWKFTVNLSAYNDTNNEAAYWEFRGAVRRNNSNGTALVGTVIVESDAETSLSTADASVVADDTNEALEIRVTGVAATNIRWTAVADIVQTSFGTP